MRLFSILHAAAIVPHAWIFVAFWTASEKEEERHYYQCCEANGGVLEHTAEALETMHRATEAVQKQTEAALAQIRASVVDECLANAQITTRKGDPN